MQAESESMNVVTEKLKELDALREENGAAAGKIEALSRQLVAAAEESDLLRRSLAELNAVAVATAEEKAALAKAAYVSFICWLVGWFVRSFHT